MAGVVIKQDQHTYPPVGRCIYCGRAEGKLSKEHIVPYALNGNWVLPKASCENCRAITQKYEDACLRVMFKPLRTRLGMQSRNPRQEYVQIEVVHHDNRRETMTVHHKDFPVVAYGIHLPIAGIVLGQAPTDTFPGVLLFRFQHGELENFTSRFAGIARVGGFDVTAFMRMLAKMGYSYAAAEIGSTSLHPMLADLVLARSPNAAYLSYLVGGDAEPAPKGDFSNRIELWEHTINGVVYTVVTIQLFGFMGMPKYHVVVREKPARLAQD